MTITIIEIEKQLGSLKSEVKDLHPHLREFFGKINDVKHVEYTHGPNEWGADFILTKEDSIIDEIRYVGVIVKNKSINQSDVDEVTKQIKECVTIERSINNGANKVRMNDVWVIANGNISNNAKEKIGKTEPMPGVTYIDRKKLASMMKKHGYNSICDDLPASVSICLSKQSSLAEKLKNQSVGLGIFETENIFIDQKVIKMEPWQYIHRKAGKHKYRAILAKSAVEENHTLLLYGEPGSGKSKMLQDILSHHASPDKYKETRTIPIFSTCKDMLEKHERKIENLIDHFENEHNLIDDDHDNHYMIIIDGIDECGLSYNERLDLIKMWKTEKLQEKIKKAIFASRDYMEEGFSGIPVYRVAGLSRGEIIRVIKKHLSSIDTVDRIIQDVQSSDIFNSLPRNPLAVIILINLLKDENGRNELPANLTDLFAKYAECSLGRWDVTIPEGMKQKRYEAADKILTRIAQYMIDRKLLQITENEARNHFEQYLGERNLGIGNDELFDNITNYSNFVYVNDGMFQFRHRTIAEFFYSKNFSDERINELGEYVFDVQWATILFFYVGFKKDCPLLLEKIDSIKPQREVMQFMKSTTMANILLAGYATPYTYIQNSIQSIFIDTSRHIESIISGQTDLFKKHSIMRTLFLFRLMMDYEYSRPFFKTAIEDSLIKVEDLNIEENIKATSLFLLDIVYRALGGENVFENMIKKPVNHVPVHIRLAVNHETDYTKRLGGDIKKYKRTIKRTLLNTGDIDYLYNKEIRFLPEKAK